MPDEGWSCYYGDSPTASIILHLGGEMEGCLKLLAKLAEVCPYSLLLCLVRLLIANLFALGAPFHGGCHVIMALLTEDCTPLFQQERLASPTAGGLGRATTVERFAMTTGAAASSLTGPVCLSPPRCGPLSSRPASLLSDCAMAMPHCICSNPLPPVYYIIIQPPVYYFGQLNCPRPGGWGLF
jgi:hypothetical protein